MANVLIDDTKLTALANAIRTKTGKSDTMTVSEMATEVEGISGGVSAEDLLSGAITTTLDLPTITRIEITRALSNYQFTGINAPNLEYVSNYCFDSCTNLTAVHLPSLKSTNSQGYAFYKCTSMVTLCLPAFNNIFRNNLCNTCSNLEAVDLGLPTDIYGNAFTNCSKLAVLIIRKTNSVCALNNINTFNNTPFASGKSGGTLYVPSALISSYQSATNWSTILGYENNSIAAIEGSIYETQYADGTPIITT